MGRVAFAYLDIIAQTQKTSSVHGVTLPPFCTMGGSSNASAIFNVND